MDEKQLKEINNQEENKTQEENIPEDKPDSGKKMIEWTVIGLALGFVIVASGFFIWNKFVQKQKEAENLKEQVESLKNNNSLPSNTAPADSVSDTSAGTASDAYPGWKTYTNTEIGYSLRYPSDWAVKEISGTSEVTDGEVKYITVDSPDKKYFLYFGLKGKNDSFSISNRTGVGAGDAKDGGIITILNTKIPIKLLSYQNKINEIFFGAIGQVATADGKYIFSSTFSSHADTYSGSGINPNLPEIDTAKKILGSIKIIEKGAASGSNCQPAYTEEEKLNMKGWKTLKNSKYGYSFIYSSDWQVKNSSSDDVILGGKDNSTTFQIKSNMSAFGLENYKLGSKKIIKITCKDVTATEYIADPKVDPTFSGEERMIITSFEKSGTVHTIFFTYKDIGASISSDILEGFYLTLKSIKFEN